MPANFDQVNAQLARIPGYLDAIRRAPQYTRGQVAREFAARHGIQVPSGSVDENGKFFDPNATHWYDPQYLGPAVVGAAATGGILSGLGAAGGGAGAAASQGTAAGLLPNTGGALIPSLTTAVPASIASQGISQGVGAGIGAGVSAGASAAGGGVLNALKNGANQTLGLKDYLALGVSGLGLANGMRQPEAMGGIEDMLGIAKDRVTSSQPLFDALQAMAMAQLPDYARGK